METIPAKMWSILAQDDSFSALFGVEEKEKQPDEERRAAHFLYLYIFYFIRWSITTMPLAGKFFSFVFCWLR
jgi:hypothetical protein